MNIMGIYITDIPLLITAFLISCVLTILFYKLFPHLGGNLYTTIQWWNTPRSGISSFHSSFIIFPTTR